MLIGDWGGAAINENKNHENIKFHINAITFWVWILRAGGEKI